MKIAIPTAANEICAHFGHCEAFAIFTIEAGKVIKQEMIQPPAHEPGSHPRFLHELGVSVVISGGMGIKAQDLMHQNDIEVIIGVCPLPLNELVQMYIDNKLEGGQNSCDH